MDILGWIISSVIGIGIYDTFIKEPWNKFLNKLFFDKRGL